MKLARGTRRKIDWAFATYSNGEVAVAVSIPRQKLRYNKLRHTYNLADAVITLPIPVAIDGIEIEPRLMIKLYVKPTKAQRERIQWEQLKVLCKT